MPVSVSGTTSNDDDYADSKSVGSELFSDSEQQEVPEESCSEMSNLCQCLVMNHLHSSFLSICTVRKMVGHRVAKVCNLLQGLILSEVTAYQVL